MCNNYLNTISLIKNQAKKLNKSYDITFLNKTIRDKNKENTYNSNGLDLYSLKIAKI